MATFVLIPGAGGAGDVYWSDTARELAARGHAAIPVDIREDDPALGLPEYAAIVDDLIGSQDDVVLVAQSLGGFTAPMITKPVRRIVFVNAMIPRPGETPGEWFEVTGSGEARVAAAEAAGRPTEFDLSEVFLHDIPADVQAAMTSEHREPADTAFGQPCTFDAWPDVPLHVLVGADDRLFPADFQAHVARERLGVEADVLPGGHLIAKSRPAELADRLVGYLDVQFDLARAAGELRRVAGGVRDDQLERPTPCEGWTVRQLAAHTCVFARVFGDVARHENAGRPPTDPPLPERWRDQLARDLDALVAAWRDPAAWRGEAEAGGMTMPSAQLAVVALDELVLHGWDLAAATGQPFTASDADVARCAAFADAVSDPAARQGLFAPIVDADPDANPLERLLALAGRAVR